MKQPARKAETHSGDRKPRPLQPRERFFALACGIWLGLTFIKFGNPVIFDQMIGTPRDWAEFVFTPWPVLWGYALLVVVLIAALPLFKVTFRKSDWPIALLAFWLFWQFLSSARSVEPRLSNPTLAHFVSCGAALVVGWWASSALRASAWFWTPVLVGFAYVLFVGFDQHAGGLEATRKAFYAQPNWQLYPKEYLLKIQSDRIFATLVYPNAFAGLILLIFPAWLWQSWALTVRWPRVLRGVVVGLFTYLALACFYWTGSKGGWLIALVLAGIAALQMKMPRKIKIVLVAAGLVLGISAFFWRFSAYFEKGATSVSARFIYWQSALNIAKSRPILGSGPGTFSVLFKQLKPPDAEMAKLVHNDYLEQASDSGIPGALAFASGIFALLILLYREHPGGFDLDFMLWLGLVGWALQAFIEFGLYIPALAWPTFLFFGVLAGNRQKP